MKLRARWDGTPPRVGEYLMSTTRPRYAYRITQVKNSSRVRWNPTVGAETRQLVIVVDRVDRDSVPKHARIHPWKWDRREAASR